MFCSEVQPLYIVSTREMGRLEKQIIAGALALVGILLSVVVYRGVDRTDPALTINEASQWNDPADTETASSAVLEEEPIGSPIDLSLEADVAVTNKIVPSPTPAETTDPALVEDVETGQELAPVVAAADVSTVSTSVATLITLDDADQWDNDLREYTVVSGDILGKIAQIELGSSKLVHEILMLNEGLNPNTLAVGQVIMLPGKRAGGKTIEREVVTVMAEGNARTHQVVSGDTLTGIANRYRVAGGVAAIVAVNEKLTTKSTMLQLGWELAIPE